MYPKMIYRDGVLSTNPANQRIVLDEEGELAAAADSFGAWDGKTKEGAQAPALGAGASLEAQQAAFDAAAAPQPEPEAEPEQRRPGVARGRNRQAAE